MSLLLQFVFLSGESSADSSTKAQSFFSWSLLFQPVTFSISHRGLDCSAEWSVVMDPLGSRFGQCHFFLFCCSFHCVLCGHHSDGVNETTFFTPCDPHAGSEEGEIQYHVPGRMNLFFLGLPFSARWDIPVAYSCLQDSPPWGGRTEQGVFKFHPLPTDHTVHPLERALYVSHLFWFLFSLYR